MTVEPVNDAGGMVALLRELERAYAARDLPALVACFSSTAEVTAFGTEQDEKCVGLAEVEAQFQRDWVRFEEASFIHTWIATGSHGGATWAAADVEATVTTPDGTWSGPLRSTIIAVREAQSLRIVHWHLSAPAGSSR